MLRAAIRPTLFRQNVLRGNLSKFNDVKLSQYMVPVSKNNTSNRVVLLKLVHSDVKWHMKLC